MKNIIGIILIGVFCYSSSAVASIMNDDGCPKQTCETIEVHESHTYTTTEEVVTHYTSEVVSEYQIQWDNNININNSDNNSDNNRNNNSRYNDIRRTWNKNGTCSVTMDSNLHSGWHNRWSSNDNIIISNINGFTHYDINDINECAFYLNALSTNNRSGGNNRNGGNNSTGYLSRNISFIDIYSTSFFTTSHTDSYDYFSTICTYDIDPFECPENNCEDDNSPVPEPSTMLLFGVGIFSIGLFNIKKIKK